MSKNNAFPRSRRFICFFLVSSLFIVSFSITGTYSREQVAELSADKILSMTINANPGLIDYTSDVSIKILITYSTIQTSMLLQGVNFFKAPDKCHLNIKNQSAILRNYPQAFQLRLPDVNAFLCIQKNEGKSDNKPYYILELIPRAKKGDLKKHIIWVDRKDFTRPHEELYYANEGRVMIFAKFIDIQGFKVYHIVKSNFEFPKIRLKGFVEMVHKNHKINTGLPDELFKED